jgi:hypothetical protein
MEVMEMTRFTVVLKERRDTPMIKKVVLFTLVSSGIACLLCSIALAAMPPELVVYLSFDNKTVTVKEVKDLSNYGNNGTIIGDPKVVKGNRGDALDFTQDSVVIKISDSLSKTKSAITMEAWIFARTQTTNDVISRWDDVLNGITHFEVSAGGGMRFCMRNDADVAFIDFTTTNTFPANQWVHVAETYDGATARVYFDGVEAGNKAGAGTMRDNANVKLWIGSMYATDRWFDGMIDEVCIWSKALTPDELKKSMQGTLISAAVTKSGKLAVAWGSIKQ